MVNNLGTLTGFSDISIPGWQERLLETVRARQQEAMRRSKNGGSSLREGQMHIYASSAWLTLLRRAARERDISMVSYVRRAASAFISYDLGVPLVDVVALTPAARQHNTAVGGAKEATQPDDGEGYGSWRIRTN